MFAERINEKGIGNGISMILFANILLGYVRNSQRSLTTIFPATVFLEGTFNRSCSGYYNSGHNHNYRMDVGRGEKNSDSVRKKGCRTQDVRRSEY